MDATGHILDIDQLTVSFDGFKALNGLTLYIEPGSFAASSDRTARERQP